MCTSALPSESQSIRPGFPVLVAAILLGLFPCISTAGAKDDSINTKAGMYAAPRTFRTFLPKPGETIDDPSSQLVQILLDRQDKEDFESYMVQVLFRGKPAERSCQVLEDRMVIDFYDTGKPATRLSKIRGGAIEASSIEELFYRENAVNSPTKAVSINKGGSGSQGSGSSQARIKRMVRLTLFIHEKTGDLKFRDTLDRTLIHFRLPKAPARKD